MLVLFGILYLLPVALVSIPSVQRTINQTVIDELSDRLGVPVRIERTDIRWLNRLTLEGVSLDDQSGKTLLKAGYVAVGFELLPLLRGKFVFTSVRLFSFTLNLSRKHPKDALNLQFVLDAFAGKDSVKKATAVDLRFNSVLLRRGHILYDVESESQTAGKFNANHIDVRNVIADIAVKALDKDSLNAHVKKLSLNEASGFSLERLTMNVSGNRDSACVRKFEVRLPRSDLKIDRITADFSAAEDLTSFLKKAPVVLDIAPSHICPKDLSAFLPVFKNYTDVLELSANADGSINDINLHQLIIRQGNHLQFNGRMELRNLANAEETYLFGQVNHLSVTPEGMSRLTEDFSGAPIALPAFATRAGTVLFTGEIAGFFDNLVAFGTFDSAAGSLKTDIIIGSNKEENIGLYIKGRASATELRMGILLGEGSPFGSTAFHVTLDASRPVGGKSLSGNIKGEIEEAEYKGYAYKNILLSGDFRQDGFNGMIHVNDPNGELRMDGMFRNQGQYSVFNFTAGMSHFRPDRLNLTDAYDSPDLSFSLNADFTGNTIDNLEGSIRLDSLLFLTASNRFFLERFEVAAGGKEESRRLTVASDIMNGEVSGNYSFTTITSALANTFANFLPSLTGITSKERDKIKENDFSLLLTINNTEALSDMLKLPVTILHPARISGQYNNRFNRFRLEAWLPKFKMGESLMESGHLACETPDGKATLQAQVVHCNEKSPLRNRFSLQADAEGDRIETLVNWSNNKEQLSKAALSASALFTREPVGKGKTSLRTDISVEESTFFISDSLWHIFPAAITLRDEKIEIDKFAIEHGEQYLHLDGIASRRAADVLFLDLKQIELRYIFDILNSPYLQFGGEATGTLIFNDLYKNRIVSTDLEVKDFSYARTPLGRLNLYSEWDDIQKGILLRGSIYKNDTVWTNVNGYIFPVKPREGLSLHFNANDLDISFLHIFLDDVLKDVRGQASGPVHLFGPFKNLSVVGDAFVKDGGIGVEQLNTYYTFSDSVHLDTTRIYLKEASVHDKFGNVSKADFTFNHTYFGDYNFQADILTDNMLVYEQTEKDSPMIYGIVFGSGTVSIKGNAKAVDFNINMRSRPNTSVGFDFMENSAATDYNFITFINKSNLPLAAPLPAPASETKQPPREDSGTEIRMNFQLDITPDATVELIMDRTAGDRIKGNTAGSLQVKYGNRSDLRIYGGVNILAGNYNFSWQQVIRKDFKIREGGTITFQGDPYRAIMNVNAAYSLTANIGDLDQGLLNEADRTNIPVNCLLLLDGQLQNPTITFDIELPGSNAEIERQVRSLIDTKDMMARQIVYLLVLNKFYTPAYSTAEYRSSDFSAAASSAISSQLSGLLNALTDKVQIGTNIRSSYDRTDDSEMEMLLSSQLFDSRLIFNGNVGYRNNYTLQRNVFVGEFDLEYKLTPAGGIRLKTYSHSNDMYRYLKQSRTTQGVGIMFKKEFTLLPDLFRRKRRYL
ncbi:putative protein involved in outer membrane biogenesis [Bacteroidales bacterium Barb4]|nr:putative protein involved in outer membrane biogenesis [Bacteroidales bacterium Barb4]